MKYRVASRRITARQSGFTLLELMMVVAIIGILAAIALPAYQDYMRRSRVAEGFVLGEPARLAVKEYYDRWGKLPESNAHAGLPAPELIRGRYVDAVTVKDGIVAVRFRDRPGKDGIDSRVLYLRPAINREAPTAPLLWLCGSSSDPGKLPKGYDAAGPVGENSVLNKHLTAACR